MMVLRAHGLRGSALDGPSSMRIRDVLVLETDAALSACVRAAHRALMESS